MWNQKNISRAFILPKNNKDSTLLHHNLAAKVNHNFPSRGQTMS